MADECDTNIPVDLQLCILHLTYTASLFHLSNHLLEKVGGGIYVGISKSFIMLKIWCVPPSSIETDILNVSHTCPK